MTRFLLPLFVLLFAVPQPSAGAKQSEGRPMQSDAVQALKALQRLDQRMHTTGYRLVSANAGFCDTNVPHIGFLLHDLNQYGDKEAARQAHGFANAIAINAVVPDSAAAASSLKVGDSLIAVDGQLVDEIDFDTEKLAAEKPEYRRIAAVKARVLEAAADGRVALTIMRAGSRHEIAVAATQACPSQFQIQVSKNRDASADGKMVSISSTLAEYVLDDDELAAIAAHELAHNLLKHRDLLNAQKVNRGFFGQFGKSAGRIKTAEIEADRLSVWLMANAGYDPEAAIRFWTRYGKQHGKGIFSAPTHYRWKKRVKLFEEEMAKMANAEAANGKYSPPLLLARRAKQSIN